MKKKFLRQFNFHRFRCVSSKFNSTFILLSSFNPRFLSPCPHFISFIHSLTMRERRFHLTLEFLSVFDLNLIFDFISSSKFTSRSTEFIQLFVASSLKGDLSCNNQRLRTLQFFFNFYKPTNNHKISIFMCFKPHRNDTKIEVSIYILKMCG